MQERIQLLGQMLIELEVEDETGAKKSRKLNVQIDQTAKKRPALIFHPTFINLKGLDDRFKIRNNKEVISGNQKDFH